MKKVLTLFAIFAMVGLVSCKKDPVQATITASDVTVEEGSTVKVVASTNSSAAITFNVDNSGVYSLSNDGVVSGIKPGEGKLTLKVAEVKGQFTAAEKVIKVTVTAKATPEPQPSTEAAITIDGDFADWAALASGTFSQSFGDEESTHPALTKCKVYADPDFIYVYIEWDTDAIEYVPDVEHVPFHCYINTDGNAATGGYADQFTDACTDILTEGWLYDSDGMASYDPGCYAWTGEPNAAGWSWTDPAILADGSGFGQGAGIEGKYEFKLDRSILAGLGYPVADVFSIGFDIQQNWDSVGILPMTAASEDNPDGHLPSLQVTTQK